MKKTLIRMLSTGRTGTKFMAAVFARQGYLAFHEDLYVGEPSSAINHYTNMLGDLWMEDRDEYYRFESNFAESYGRAVEAALAGIAAAARRNRLLRLAGGLFNPKGPWKKIPAVVHSAHLLTTATPLVVRDLSARGVACKHLILVRNPIKTIHALYLAEHQAAKFARPYMMRPLSFSGDDGYLGAARVWANTYALAHDQMERLGPDGFRVVALEDFSNNVDYVAQVFDFLGLEFDPQIYRRQTEEVLKKPFRSSKTDSERNSHLFRDPGFQFNAEELEAIHREIEPVLDSYAMDWDPHQQDYLDFHARVKEQIGFDRQ